MFSRTRAFALPELIATLVIAVMVAALFAVTADRSRRMARLGDDIANLSQIGGLTRSFANDNSSLFWTFSWKKGESKSKYNDLNNAESDVQAAANQAVDILRRRAGREDIPKISGWVPNFNYNHLVLAEYADMKLPERMFISSGDANRLLWAGDPFGFDQGKFGSKQPPPSTINKRWPYSSSYQQPPIFWSSPTSGSDAISQAGAYNLFLVPANAQLGACRTDEIVHPSQKVFFHDQWSWHFGRNPYHGLQEARLPLLFCDGSVSARASGEAGPGWQPNAPGNLGSTSYSYQPQSWEPPPMQQGGDTCVGFYRWTRWARDGRDYGGPEIKK